MTVQYSIINHNVGKNIILSLIKNLKRFCDPDIITYSDYNYEIKDDIAIPLNKHANYIFERTVFSFEEAYHRNINKILLVNSREMYFKKPIKIIQKNNFATNLIIGTRKEPINTWIGYFFRDKKNSKKIHRFIKRKWTKEFLFTMPSQGGFFDKDFIKYFYYFCKKRNISVIKDDMDEIYFGCILSSYFMDNGFLINDIPNIKYNFEENFDKNSPITEEWINGKMGKYNYSHNLQIWPSRKICEKYNLKITRGEEGAISLRLIKDLMNNLVDVSPNYCSIRRFSINKKDEARLFLE